MGYPPKVHMQGDGTRRGTQVFDADGRELTNVYRIKRIDASDVGLAWMTLLVRVDGPSPLDQVPIIPSDEPAHITLPGGKRVAAEDTDD